MRTSASKRRCSSCALLWKPPPEVATAGLGAAGEGAGAGDSIAAGGGAAATGGGGGAAALGGDGGTACAGGGGAGGGTAGRSGALSDGIGRPDASAVRRARRSMAEARPRITSTSV